MKIMSEYYYKLIRSMRIDKKVSQKQLSNGLCSVSMLSYIEKGEKVPSIELSQRLLDRLGGSFQNNISIFKGKEYIDKKEKTYFISLVKEANWEELKLNSEVIQEKIKDTDTINQQFYYDMLGRIYISEKNYQKAREAYKHAADCTMKGISLITLNQFLLAPIEYYYLIMYYYCLAEAKPEEGEIACDFMQAILEKIDRSDMAETKKCGIYSFAIEKYYEIVNDKEWFNIILLNSKVDVALSMLIRANRTFNLMGLLKIKAFIYDGMKGGEKEKKIYDDRIEALEEIYRIAGVRNNTNCSVNFLYDEVSIDISDMIRKRRMLLGYTQNQLADGICSVKTLRRIEQGIVNSQYAVIEPLLQRLGLSGERQYDNFITDDWEVLRTTHEYRVSLRAGDYIQAKYLLAFLEQKVKKIPQNIQILKNEKAFLDYTNKEIQRDEFLDLLDEALCETLELSEVSNHVEGFYTEREIQCLYDMAMVTDKYKNIDFKNFFSDFFNENNGNNLSKGLQALILRWLSDKYEKERNFVLSDKYAKKALQVDLLNSKLSTARKSLYDIAWNSVKSGEEKDMFSQEIYHTLTACLVLSEFVKDERGVEFLRQKLDIILEKKGDWTN